MALNPSEEQRDLPSVETLAASLQGSPRVAVLAARAAIGARRAEIVSGTTPSEDLRRSAERRLAELERGSLRRVINATGVVLHTNLGRAPLAAEAIEAVEAVSRGYSNLEYDLDAGARGSRHAHVEDELRAISGAEAAIAVNNNAAAVLLALAATAGGQEVVVGRDQLIEIGGSFRIPEILRQSGADLVEVGTTNRTRIEDYAGAIGARTGALLRVHQSNFRTTGFTEETPLTELCALARERAVAVIDDLGSGALTAIADEPMVQTSVKAGADLVCCSADKLLGGPQAGLLFGSSTAVERCRRHPLARALRLDKLQLAALAATLRMHRDGRRSEVPAVAMIEADAASLTARAAILREASGNVAELAEADSRPGGGTLPTTVLPGTVCTVGPGSAGAETLLDALRASDPPVIARIAGGRVILDPRTMSDEDAREAGAAVSAAVG